MKRLAVFLLSVIIGWTLLGKIPKENWDKLSPKEQIAIVNAVIYKTQFFEKTSCGKAEFRVMTDNQEVLIFVQCVEPRLGV